MPASWASTFQVGLVGLDDHDRVALLDGVAFLLEPLDIVPSFHGLPGPWA